jgi:hypothetical protein
LFVPEEVHPSPSFLPDKEIGVNWNKNFLSLVRKKKSEHRRYRYDEIRRLGLVV